MNTAWRHSLLTGSLCLLATLLAGCSAGSGKGLGKAGNQSSYKPVAVITPIGQVSGPDGTLYVRSGAEVLLSSKDSDGRDSAVLGITWSATNSAAQAVKMLERGANAMSFRAPTPLDDTPLELRFGLSIRTADGDTAATAIRVLVSRAPDPDDFLLSDVSTTVDAVNLVVVASAATTTPTFATDIPFTIGVQKQVRYKRAIEVGANPSASPAANDPLYCLSPDPTLTCVKIGPPLQLTGAWKASTGVIGTLRPLGTPLTVMGAAYQNPRFRLRPPSLNADEVNFAVLTNGIATNVNGTGVPPEDARRNNLLYTADIDSAEAEYAFTMTSSDLGATGRRVDLLVFAADSTAPGSLTYLAEGQATTAADPGIATVTTTQALDSIKTAPGVVESRDSAEAYYTAIDPAGKRTTLDDWMNDNCMQRALSGGAPGYYGTDTHATYLNNRDLGFGREMYFKSDCTSAERGATNATINTVGGERASIVFNYSSLEAAIKRNGAFLAVAMEYRADAAGGVKYTRFYTFAPDPRTRVWKRVTSANFDGRRERYTPGNCTVCHGGKPQASYAATAGAGDLGSTFIPWDANALLFADTDPSILDDRLQTGFTRAAQLPNIHALNSGVAAIVESRIAETQPTGEMLDRWNAVREVLGGWTPILPPAGSPNLETFSFVPAGWRGASSANSPSLSSETLYGQVIAENCRMCHLQRIADTGAAGLAASTAPQFNAFTDSYFSGANIGKLQQRVFQQHIMPASRLTSDRFWIAQPGSNQSAAQVLAAHLGLTLPAAIPSVTALADGPSQVETATAAADVRLSALRSPLASSYSWSLSKPIGSAAVLVGANTAEPAFHVDVSGEYQALLTVGDSSGRQATLDVPLTVVADAKPHATNFPISANSGDIVSIVFSTEGVTLGDGVNTLSAAHNLPGTTLGYPATCTGTGFVPTSTCAITFTAAGSGTINYQFVDADGDASSGSITVAVALPNQWSIATRNISTGTCSAGQGTNACSTSLGISALALAKAALNLTNLTDPQFTAAYAVAVNVVQPGRVGRTGATGSVAASSTAMSYTPPPYYVSSQSGVSMADAFQFNVTVRNAAAPNAVVSQSANAIVNMTVSARSTWSTVFALLQANCSSCHGLARSVVAAPPLANERRAWGSLTTDTSGVTTYDDLAGTRRTQCPDDDVVTAYCVDFGNPAGSMLLHKPKGEFAHVGGNIGLTTGQFDTIENWIRDGAYRN